MARISYREGYDDQSVLKQLWDDGKDIQDLQMGIADYPIDAELDPISRYPVQNQVITAALAEKQDKGDYVDEERMQTVLSGYASLPELVAAEERLQSNIDGKQDRGDYVTSDVLDDRLDDYATDYDVDVAKTELRSEIATKQDASVLIRKIHIGTSRTPSASLGSDGDLYIWRP